MFKLKHSILLSLFFLTGFSIFAQNGVTYIDSIKSNTIFRKYRLYVPNSYTGQAVPLVFNLHGYTSNASQQQLYSNFMPIADTAKFIIIIPEGTAPTGPQYWNAGFGPGANDVLFMNDLIDSLDLNYNIDLNSVYSCGMSNGGIMSYYLACNLPNRFAAIASVTGSMINPWFTCAPNRPFPIMEIHGTNDATVPYNGDATFANIDTVIKKWSVHNNCNPTSTIYNVPDINTTDGATAINYKYTGGTNGAEVELYKVINGAHTWPGAAFAARLRRGFSTIADLSTREPQHALLRLPPQAQAHPGGPWSQERGCRRHRLCGGYHSPNALRRGKSCRRRLRHRPGRA